MKKKLTINMKKVKKKSTIKNLIKQKNKQLCFGNLAKLTAPAIYTIMKTITTQLQSFTNYKNKT